MKSALVDGERGVLVERIVNSDQSFCPHGIHRSTASRTDVFTGYLGQRVGKRLPERRNCVYHKLTDSRQQAEHERH